MNTIANTTANTTAELELAFFRHSVKEDPNGRTDKNIPLSVEGVRLASGTILDNSALIKGYSSPRLRAQQTGNYLLGDLKDKKLPLGGERIEDDERLDFQFDISTPTGKILNDKGLIKEHQGDYIRYLLEDSDRDSKKNNDKENNTTGETFIANISSIILDYINTFDRWSKIVDKNKYKNKLQRIFTTHQGIGETFLAKIIEDDKGVAIRNDFLESLDGQGFGFIEGFSVIITQNNNCRISFSKKSDDGKIMFEYTGDVTKEQLEKLI